MRWRIGSAGAGCSWLSGVTSGEVRCVGPSRAALRREGCGEHWDQHGCDGEMHAGDGDALGDRDAVPGNRALSNFMGHDRRADHGGCPPGSSGEPSQIQPVSPIGDAKRLVETAKWTVTEVRHHHGDISHRHPGPTHAGEATHRW